MTRDAPLEPLAPTPLSPEDLTFWYADQPRQRTTMAMLMLLDRRPDPKRLRAAAARAVEAVPRLRQRIVDAPFDLALPRWEEDSTFDLDFHVRRYALAGGDADENESERLFRTLGPIYERPFERTRPLWELIEIDRPGDLSAIFFRLHHAVADGVGGNTILAALTDAVRDGEPLPPAKVSGPGAWPEQSLGAQLVGAIGRRVLEDAARAGVLARALLHGLRHPSVWIRVAEVLGDMARELRPTAPSPLRGFGRARHLAGISLPFAPLREARTILGDKTIDLLLAGVADAMGRWYAARGLRDVKELRTLVPINLRPREEQGLTAGLGNRATGIVIRLPIGGGGSVRQRVDEIHKIVEEAKARPSLEAMPAISGALTALPRPLFRALSLGASSAIDLVVTNVPGIPVTRFLAGAEITAAYPFAPIGPHSPLSVALYGYRDRLFIGLDADGALLPDPAAFTGLLYEAFTALELGAREEAARRSARTARRRSKSSSA
jgi:diacylglycerol O-acyltransferase